MLATLELEDMAAPYPVEAWLRRAGFNVFVERNGFAYVTDTGGPRTTWERYTLNPIAHRIIHVTRVAIAPRLEYSGLVVSDWHVASFHALQSKLRRPDSL